MQIPGIHHAHHLPSMSPARLSGSAMWHPPTELAIADPVMVTTAVAVEKDRNSNFAVKWAIENLLSANLNHSLILVHVISRHAHLNRRYLSLSSVFILILTFWSLFSNFKVLEILNP